MTLSKLLENFLLTDLKLDKNQFAAVFADGNKDKSAYRILVTAPAGSGKTRVLASRYLKLLVDGQDPQNIVAITFTRKAAGEMKRRIFDYVFEFRKLILQHGISSNRALKMCDPDTLNKMVLSMRISTIDSFLSNIIRLFPGEAGVDPNFKVVDEIEEDELIDRTIDEYIEEHMQHDRSIIELLRFFDFKYADTGFDRFCFSRVLRGTIKQWEIYHDVINTITSVPDDTYRSWITEFVGCDQHIDDNLFALRETAIALGKSVGKQNKLRPFIDYMIASDILEIKHHDSEFLEFIDLFYTKQKKLRKRPMVTFSNEHEKNLFETMIGHYDNCISDFLFIHDIQNSRLSKPFVNLLLHIVDRIKFKKRELGILGIGDLKTITHGLLSSHAERFNILFNMDARVNHYLIDEFQDTDPMQWNIFERLTEDWFSGETAKQERNVIPTLFLVGDEKQSIYGFRNADVRIINTLSETDDYFTVSFPLKTNYRSGKEIVSCVNSLFEQHMKRRKDRPTSVAYKAMKPADNADKSAVSIVETDFEGTKDERMPKLAALVKNTIMSIRDPGTAWGTIALLFRDSLCFHYFEHAFEASSIPYISSGGKSFFENTEVHEVMKILSFLDNPHDDTCFAALLLSPLFDFGLEDLLNLRRSEYTEKRANSCSLFSRLGIDTTPQFSDFACMLNEWLQRKDRVPIEQLLEEILLDINAYGILVDRKGGQKDVNIRKLLTLVQNISRETTSFSFFFEKLSRIMKAREKNADIDIGTAAHEMDELGAVHLLTVHKAKGLEFPIVMLPQIDATAIRTRVEGIVIDREKPHILFLKKYAGMDPPLLQCYKMRVSAREEEELKRLLYVALTRAENKLYLFMNIHQGGEKKVWMNIIESSNVPRIKDLDLKFATMTEDLLLPGKEQAIYQFSSAKPPRKPEKQTRPSDLHGAPTEFSVQKERAKLKGTVLHKLFELISTGKIDPKGTQLERAVKILVQQCDSSLLGDESLQDQITAELTNALRNEEIRDIVTDPEGLTEFPFSLDRIAPDGSSEVVSGVIDRVLMTKQEVRIYDYKSDSPGDMNRDQFIAHMIDTYQGQLNEYRSAVHDVLAIENIRTFLILTSIAEVVEI